MSKRIGLLLLLAAAGLLSGASRAEEITVAAGATRAKAINAFQSRLVIEGKLAESVFLVGGSLRLDGEVTGDVICIAARVEIGATAVIGRDLIVIGGRFTKADGARIAGELYNIRTHEDLKKIAGSFMPFLPERGGMTFFRVVKDFFWLVLCLIMLAVFPGPIAQAAAMLAQAPLRHLGRGLLTILLFILLLFFCVLLSFILIGIPLLIVLLAAYFLLLIFGRAAVFYFVGDRLSRLLKWKANPALFIVLGLTAYALLKFIPYVGGILIVVTDVLVLGIAVGFFLRRRKATI